MTKIQIKPKRATLFCGIFLVMAHLIKQGATEYLCSALVVMNGFLLKTGY